MGAQSAFMETETVFFLLERDIEVPAAAPGKYFTVVPDDGLIERLEDGGPFAWFNPARRSVGVMGGNALFGQEHCAVAVPLDVVREFRIQPYTGRHADHLEFCAQLQADDPGTYYNGPVLLTLRGHGLHALDAFAALFSVACDVPVQTMEPFTD